MHMFLTGLLALGLVHADQGAATQRDKAPAPLLDVWETVHLEGQRVGYRHTTAQDVDVDGSFRLRVATELSLSLPFYKTPVRLRRIYSDDEASDGRIFALSLQQFQGERKTLDLSGKVEADRLRIVAAPKGTEYRLPWRPEIVGLGKQDSLFVDRRPAPREQFAFARYEPTYMTILIVRVKVGDWEPSADGKSKQLRVELKPDRLETKNGSIQPAATVLWLDEGYNTVKREIEVEEVGKLVCVRATRDAAQAPASVNSTRDLGLSSQVRIAAPIARPYDALAARYRITLKGEPSSAFVSDGHQQVRDVQGEQFELAVHPVQGQTGQKAGPAAAEYLAPNYFIDHTDERVRQLAHRAANGERDPWTRAQRIERWVHDAIQVENGLPLVPASQVANRLRGDCRAHAILTTAMCRAEGLPARTAVGLLYGASNGPHFGFHIWTEACIGGNWVGLDSTLGLGHISACHIKVADDSWSGVRSLTPALPVQRVLGKVTINVISTDGR